MQHKSFVFKSLNQHDPWWQRPKEHVKLKPSTFEWHSVRQPNFIRRIQSKAWYVWWWRCYICRYRFWLYVSASALNGNMVGSGSEEESQQSPRWCVFSITLLLSAIVFLAGIVWFVVFPGCAGDWMCVGWFVGGGIE